MTVKAVTATIANAGTTTPTITLDSNRSLLGVEMPSAFTGTTITFTASSSSSGTPVPLYYESTLYSVTVAASRFVSLNPDVFAGVKYLQVVSGSTQAASRDLVLIYGD